MKKALGIFGGMIIALGLLLIGTGMFLLHTGPFAGGVAKEISVNRKPLTELDWLEVDGKEIINQDEETVLLTGMNLGGWLQQEYWMCPLLNVGDATVSGDQVNALYALETLEERFGVERTQELMELYQSNWITEVDIANIASMGCNVIRVPFWYRNFMYDAEGNWITENPDKNPGFQKLDWVIETASRYGMYVILDMHGCPGGQGTNQCSGTGTMDLFASTEYQQVMENLWVAIAERYKDEPAVAAYDIMNEPEGLADEQDPKQDIRNQIYDRMIKAIRKVDSRHIIAVEGIWSLKQLPKPAQQNWKNVIYEIHCYGETEDLMDWAKESYDYGQYHKIPIYVGEYKNNPELVHTLKEYGIHNTTWTYKGIALKVGKREFTEPSWFQYYQNICFPVFVKYDPDWLIELKWGNGLKTSNFKENMDLSYSWK